MIQTIETVGAIVRHKGGGLSTIAEVLEFTRMSPNHVSSPGDVVVRLEPYGPGFGHASAWASDLMLGAPGDIGSHAHDANCTCGAEPNNPQPHWGWVYVGASWERQK